MHTALLLAAIAWLAGAVGTWYLSRPAARWAYVASKFGPFGPFGLAALARDATLLACAPVLAALPLPSRQGAGTAPLLIIPGVLPRGYFLALVARLRRDGHSVRFARRSSSRATVAEAAALLLDDVPAAAPLPCWIAFGAGGWVAAGALRLGPERSPRRLITVGTPWDVSPAGYLSLADLPLHRRPAGGDALPLPSHTSLCCLACPDDRLLPPGPPPGGAETSELRGTGHLGLVWSTRSLNLIASWVEAP